MLVFFQKPLSDIEENGFRSSRVLQVILKVFLVLIAVQSSLTKYFFKIYFVKLLHYIIYNDYHGHHKYHNTFIYFRNLIFSKVFYTWLRDYRLNTHQDELYEVVWLFCLAIFLVLYLNNFISFYNDNN